MPEAGDDNIVADPRFASPSGSWDNRLSADSPCIDAGVDEVIEPGSSDIFGNPRIHGKHVDMGAVERMPVSAWKQPDGLRFDLPTWPGVGYVVEYGDHVPAGDAEWHALTNLSGNGSTALIWDPQAGSLNRFYRVRVF
jgi:hypothetical protein